MSSPEEDNLFAALDNALNNESLLRLELNKITEEHTAKTGQVEQANREVASVLAMMRELKDSESA